jgi:peptidoglycan glycosyltransferase
MMAAADTAALPSPTSIATRERVLLVLAALFVVLNRVTLLVASRAPWYEIWPLGLWALTSLGMHVMLKKMLPHRDPFILPIVMLLAGWGLTLIARLAPQFAVRQTIWLPVSGAAALSMAALPASLRILRRYRYTWLLLGLLLLAATLILGVNPSGNAYAPRLWLGFWPVYFQPSEVLKLLLVIFLASYLAEKREMLTDTSRRSLPYLSPMLAMWGFCMILLVWQRDLGTASLFFLIFISVLYAATGQNVYVVTGLFLLLAASVAGYLLFDVVRLRFDTWWNPWPEASSRAFQIVQSLISIASGGLVGQGVGSGAPGFVPVVHSDFVYTAIAEEWGLIGSIGVVICLALLVLHTLRIALANTERPFHLLLATGIAVSLGVQSFMIMAGILRLIPLTGVTLPFVSYGGSSLLSSFTMIGLLLRISDPVSSPGAGISLIRGRLIRRSQP